MKPSKYLFFLLVGWLFISFTGTSCVTFEKSEKKSTAMGYSIAKGYFVKNSIAVNEPFGLILQNQQQLDSVMGMAATMGVDGKPTNFDFGNEYGVAYIFPQTDSSKIVEVLDYFVAQGTGRISIKVTTGEKQTYSIVPCILIKVSGIPPAGLVVDKHFVSK